MKRLLQSLKIILCFSLLIGTIAISAVAADLVASGECGAQERT